MTTDPQTELSEPDNPAAWALARHIADHPVSTIQAAFRYLNAPVTVELHDPVSSAVAQSAPADRAAVLAEAAEALGRMDYEADSQDYGYDTFRDAWNGGVMDAAAELRSLVVEERAEREAQAHLDQLAVSAVCICGHTEQQHFEDACITEVTGCDCGDYLTPEAAREVIGRLQQEVKRLGLMVDEYGHGASALTYKLKRVRDLHRETCILAQGAVRPTAFTCGMCEVLDAPAAAPAVSSVGQAAHTTRSAVLREAADFYDRLLADMGADTAKDPRYWTGVQHVATGLRRMAVETQPAEAEAPFPPDSAWTIQSHRRGSWQRWLADRHDRNEAREDYDGVITRHGQQWAFRLIRADTSYAVEAEHTPASQSAPEPLCLPYHPAAEESGS